MVGGLQFIRPALGRAGVGDVEWESVRKLGGGR